MKKVYPKTSNPIFYTRNVGGKKYKLVINAEGLDISKFPDELVEDLFQTWGKQLLSEEQHKAIQGQVPKVEPTVHEPHAPAEPQVESPAEVKQEEQQPEQPQEQAEEKKDEPVSEPAPEEVKGEEVKEEKAEEAIPQPEDEKKEDSKPDNNAKVHRGRNFGRRN